MIKLIKIEFFKLRRSAIWLVVSLLPLISAIWGVCFVLIFRAVPQEIKSEISKVLPGGTETWNMLFAGSVSLYMPLMLPVMTAVIMTWLTRMEHQQNVWKSVLTLPVRRSSFFLSKFFTGVVMIFASVLLLSLFMLIAALAVGAKGPAPVSVYVLNPILSTLTILPVALLYLIISMRFSNPAIPIAAGGILSMPVSMIVNTETKWIFYPWCYPARLSMGDFTGQEYMLAVMPAVCAVLFAALMFYGLMRFGKKDVI